MTRATHSTVVAFVSEYDPHLLGEGKHYRWHEQLGAHLVSLEGVAGVHGA